MKPILLAAALAGAAASAHAQYAITWSTIDCGGAQNAQAGAFTLSGTTGQHDASAPLAARTFALASGYWTFPSFNCPADFNRDGFLDFFDYDDYVGCFEISHCPPGASPDFNNDGFLDFFDYDDFVSAFEQGC